VRQYRKQTRVLGAATAADKAILRRKELIALLKDSASFDLRRCNAELWLICSADSANLEKVLATANIIVLSAELDCSLASE
jgi:hypothetical protein